MEDDIRNLICNNLIILFNIKNNKKLEDDTILEILCIISKRLRELYENKNKEDIERIKKEINAINKIINYLC